MRRVDQIKILVVLGEGVRKHNRMKVRSMTYITQCRLYFHHLYSLPRAAGTVNSRNLYEEMRTTFLHGNLLDSDCLEKLRKWAQRRAVCPRNSINTSNGNDCVENDWKFQSPICGLHRFESLHIKT